MIKKSIMIQCLTTIELISATERNGIFREHHLNKLSFIIAVAFSAQVLAAPCQEAKLMLAEIRAKAESIDRSIAARSTDLIVVPLNELFAGLASGQFTANSPLPYDANLVKGAFYDSTAKSIALVCRAVPNRLPLSINDVLLAFQCAFLEEAPFCSIDGPKALHLGPDCLQGTSFGASLFEADLLLKLFLVDPRLCGRIGGKTLADAYQHAISDAGTIFPEQLSALLDRGHGDVRFWIEPRESNVEVGPFLFVRSSFTVRFEKKSGFMSRLDRAAYTEHTKEIAAAFDNAAEAFPPVGRVASLFDLYRVADALVSIREIRMDEIPLGKIVKDAPCYTEVEESTFPVSFTVPVGVPPNATRLKVGVTVTGGVQFARAKERQISTINRLGAIALGQVARMGPVDPTQFISLMGIKPTLASTKTPLTIDEEALSAVENFISGESFLHATHEDSSVPVSVVRILLYLQSHYFQNALEEIERSKELAPDLKDHFRGLAFTGWNKSNSAIDAFTRASSANRTNLVSRVALASVYYDKGKFDQALKLLNEVLEVESNNLILIRKRARAHFGLRHYREAAADFQRCLDGRTPYDQNERKEIVNDLWQMATAFFETGDSRQAIFYYKGYLNVEEGDSKHRKQAERALQKLQK